MDFSWTEEQTALRERVRELLARELPPDWERLSRHGPGSPEQTAFSLDFCPKLADAGLLVPHWPVEHGGSGAPPWHHFIIGEELWAAGEPRGAQYMNVNFIGQTVMRFGSLEQKQFLRALEECLTRLPAKTAQVFMMREHLGYETPEICKELGLTPTHCWVLIYRARLALRECLQINWFAK